MEELQGRATSSLRVRTWSVGTVSVVAMAACLNKNSGEEIADACEALIAEGSRRIVLNLQNCSMANSVGISYLIDVVAKMKELGGQISFCYLTPTLAKTITIVGLLNEAQLYDTEQEAVQAQES